MRYSKESLDAEKRKDPDKTGARLSTQVSYSPQHSQKREQNHNEKKKSEWEEKKLRKRHLSHSDPHHGVTKVQWSRQGYTQEKLALALPPVHSPPVSRRRRSIETSSQSPLLGQQEETGPFRLGREGKSGHLIDPFSAQSFRWGVRATRITRWDVAPCGITTPVDAAFVQLRELAPVAQYVFIFTCACCGSRAGRSPWSGWAEISWLIWEGSPRHPG